MLETAGVECEDLDETVHETAANIAAGVNNSSLQEQVEYLLDEGAFSTPEALLECFGVTPPKVED
jgi:hypothetical protein